MKNLRKELTLDIASGIAAASAAGKLVVPEDMPAVLVRRTEDSAHGDYSSPIALSITKHAKIAPMDIVTIIAEHMPKKKYIGKLEAAMPGFLNIRISPEYLASRMDDVHAEGLAEGCALGEGKSINMEFISANPTGPLTLGNARTAFTADTLGNVFGYAGYSVTREYYINDAGAQIARLGESVLRRILQQEGKPTAFAEDLYQGEYIFDIAKNIAEQYKEEEGKTFEEHDVENAALVADISDRAMKVCLDAIKETIKNDLNISFDVWSSEKTVRESGEIEKVLEKLRTKELTHVTDGAEFLETTKFGDDKDRVIVKKDGQYAYIMPDIAYHQGKFDREYDLIFDFFGADHQGHIPKLKAALAALGNDTEKLHAMVTQWFVLTRGGKQVEFSKRKGNVYSPKELIDEIGYDVARYLMVQHALSSHMNLDLDAAKEKSDANPVYYVQYAYVRLQSILRKAKERDMLHIEETSKDITSHVAFTHVSESSLALELFRFPEIIEDITISFNVHLLTFYAYDLARAINSFYRDVHILSEEDVSLRASRLQVAFSARTVLGEILDLLGISKPDVM